MGRKLWIATLLCVALGALTALGLTEGSRSAGSFKSRSLGLKVAAAAVPQTPSTQIAVDPGQLNTMSVPLAVRGMTASPRMEPAAIVVAVESSGDGAPLALPDPPAPPHGETVRATADEPAATEPATIAPPAIAPPATLPPAAESNNSVNVVLDEISRVRQALGAVVADLTEIPADAKDGASSPRADQPQAARQFAEALARLAAQPEPPAEWVDLDAVEPRQPISERARESLRRTSRDLEQLAADLEDASHFEDADRIRTLVYALRVQARRMQGVPIHETPNY